MMPRRLISWATTVSLGVAADRLLAALRSGGMSGRAVRTSGRIRFFRIGVAVFARSVSEELRVGRCLANGRRALKVGPSWSANGFTATSALLSLDRDPGRSAT